VTRPNEFAHWDPRVIDGPVVAAASALNGLGFDPWQTWAFRRAELTAYAASAFRCPNGKLLTMGAIRTFPPQARAELRMESIVTALLDSLAPDLESMGTVRSLAALVTLSAIPSAQSPGYQARASRIVRRVNDWLSERLAPGVTVVVEHDHRAHAGLAHALLRVVPALLDDRVDAALLLGVESYYDPDVLSALFAGGRLHDGENLDGFIPGEGGAGLLVVKASRARAMGRPVRARIEGAATAWEAARPDNDLPCLGEALTAVSRSLTDVLSAQRRSLDWWLCDVTGDALRQHEFQLAWPRAGYDVMGPTGALEYLPETLGDLGAATLHTAVAVAGEGFLRGDPAAETCLVTGSSDEGPRGAVLLSRG
jgi:3-oxoacyl-[acyl-carrier-protein] synthase-1